jgi:quinol monooxygenase YgiN
MTRLFAVLISTMMFSSQAPAPSDLSAFAVVYVDVMPASKAAAVAAFKQYRELSRKDEGFVRLDMFEQVGRPGHLVILETWTNAKAFDTHAAAPHSKDWRSKIDAIRLSEYDQRPYKPLAAGSAPASAGGGAIYVVTHVDIGGQGTNAPDMLKRLAETSRKEEGNLRFDVLQHAMRANHFTILEAWQSQKALETHAAASHTRQHREALSPMTGSPVDERIYKVAE